MDNRELLAYTGDSYDTTERKARPWYDWLFLKSRFGFYISFITDIVFRFRKEVFAGIYDEQRWGYSSRYTKQVIEQFDGTFHIRGMDNLKKVDGPVVFIGNHMSTLETLILPGIIVPYKPVTFVVKEGLTKGNMFGVIMRSRNPIAVGRVNPREDLTKVLTEGVEKLSAGESIIIFPQSTRSAVFDESKFNSLGIKLAIKAGVPVIPIALKTDYWGDSKIVRGFGPIRRKNPIHIEIGEPIHPEGRGKAEHQHVIDFIESRLRSWGAKIAGKDGSDSPSTPAQGAAEA